MSSGEKVFQLGSYPGQFKASHPLQCLALWSCTAKNSNNFVFEFCIPGFLTVISEMFSQWSISPLPQTLPFKEDWPGAVIIQNGLSDSPGKAGLQSLYQQKLSVETSK